MFTGIIQDIGVIQDIQTHGENRRLTLATKLAGEIAIGDSVAISGVCLTAESIGRACENFTATAVAETLAKSKLGSLTSGERVNLELALRPSDRLGGHFVQGHVDAIGRCENITPAAGSWILTFSYPREHAALVVEKGSIAIDGVSLTAYDIATERFRVSIIPQTWNATTLGKLRPGSIVNLEFDILGKYVQRRREAKEGQLSWEALERYGY